MEFSPLRRAAVRLACLHADDRQWILANLAADERRKIDALLGEISELGLASEPSVMAGLIDELAAQPQAQVSAHSHVLHKRLLKSGHPFWAGLALQLETPAQRREALSTLANSASIRRWDTTFAKHSMPPALVSSLRDYLARSGGQDER
ncbi:hypothetical protein [Pseudomonas palleroniana]|uniref:Uncharacterized protein n=1 Tax=Pseudomonas palleroniana TaxID=191390 RepID=A0A120EAI8_9PSED|nr:hypothetical protein [Pseudomonas palleroniana]KWU52861.1 hypothetical protein AWV77_00900 [Pseudomonas palleroniana]